MATRCCAAGATCQGAAALGTAPGCVRRWVLARRRHHKCSWPPHTHSSAHTPSPPCVCQGRKARPRMAAATMLTVLYQRARVHRYLPRWPARAPAVVTPSMPASLHRTSIHDAGRLLCLRPACRRGVAVPGVGRGCRSWPWYRSRPTAVWRPLASTITATMLASTTERLCWILCRLAVSACHRVLRTRHAPSQGRTLACVSTPCARWRQWHALRAVCMTRLAS